MHISLQFFWGGMNKKTEITKFYHLDQRQIWGLMFIKMELSNKIGFFLFEFELLVFRIPCQHSTFSFIKTALEMQQERNQYCPISALFKDDQLTLHSEHILVSFGIALCVML